MERGQGSAGIEREDSYRSFTITIHGEYVLLSFNSSFYQYTLRTNSSLHCISSSKPAIQLYRDSSTVTEMKIYSGLGYLF